MKAKLVARVFLDLVFPPRCIYCDRALAVDHHICPECLAEMVPEHHERCMRDGKSGKTILCTAPFLYDGKIRDTIHRFKFSGMMEIAPYLAEAMIYPITESCKALQLDFITAVPLFKKRLKRRGYNQAELLGREVGKLLKVPYEETLLKIKDNRAQHTLSRKERIDNVKGVYRVLPGCPVSGKSILLIDDVVTTGSTITECAKMLLAAGADTVLCAAVADDQ